ncbi:uncharacterized protein G2W53_014357 [Senna tora]|uniref:Uncharacterized protein n=1 Tax=Senna tora TaxID=362788 RepID=A0A834WTJ7_9FABA|nr:uncharacterized protein G2W53_014357 [Senna tora]
MVGSQKPSRITRQKTCCASESNTSVCVVFANRSGFDTPIGVVLASEECESCLNIFRMTNPVNMAWEEPGSCINIFRMTNRGRILETFLNYEAKDLLRKGFDAPICVVLAWEERGSSLNIFKTKNCGRISETFTNYDAKDLLRKNLHELRGKRLVAQVSQTRRFALYLRAGVVLMLQLESSWNGRSLDHVLKYSGRKIKVGSQKPSRITRQETCCASESNTSVRFVFANQSGFHAPVRVVLALEGRGSCLNMFRMTNRGRISETFMNYEAKDLFRKDLHELRGKRLVAQVSQTRWFAVYSKTVVVLMLQFESSWHGRSVDHVLTYSGRQIAVGSQKPSRITRQKTCCASESNTSVRVVFASWSGFDAPIGVVLEWEEFGSCLKIFWTKNHGRISETFKNYEAKDLLRKSQKPSRITREKTCCASESNTSVRVVFANRSGFDAPIGVVLAWEERGSCLNIFRTPNHGGISKTFTNFEAKDLLRKLVKHSTWHGRNVDHVLTYSGQQIMVGSQKPSRITRQKTCCASESNTSVCVVFANRSGFDTPIGVVLASEECESCRNIFRMTNPVNMAWEEPGSCINIFRMTNRGRILETFLNYEAKDLLRKGFDAPICVVLAWEERGSSLNIFKTKNCGRISETFTNYDAKDLLRKNLHELRGKRLVAQVSQTRRFALYLRAGVVLMLQLESSWNGRSLDHVLKYSGRKIKVGSQKPSRITRQETCCASESNTSVRFVFANQSGFHAPVRVVLALEGRGSCLNMFRMTNRDRISETFMNYEAKDLFRNESNTLVRSVFENRSGFDAPIRVVLAWEKRGSCLNIFRTTNRGGISETFTNYEAKDLLRKSLDHVLKYSGRKIMVGSQKPSRITRQKTRCASESNTSVRVVLANRSGFDSPIGVVMALEEHGSCLNIFRTKNRGRISETFTNYEAKDLLRNESNTSVRFVFVNKSGFHAPVGVVLAWEERGSCLNIFRTTNRGRISETFMNYEAKDLLRKSVDHVLTYSGRQIAVGSQKPSRITRQKTCCASESNTSVRVVFASRSGFDAPIAVVLEWEEFGSCLKIFWTKNHGRISKTFKNYEAKDLLRKSVDHVLTYSGQQIAVVSQKPSRITRQKTCCPSESNTSVRVVFANHSGFDTPIGVVMAWEERGSCLDIFQTTNRSQISETFTNYEGKDLLPNESDTSVRVVFANRSGFDAPIGVVLAWEERGSCPNIFRTTNRGRIPETFTNYEAKDLLCNCHGIGGAWTMIQHISNEKLLSDLRNLHDLRGKRLVAKISETRRFALYLQTRVVLMLQLHSTWHGRSVDHVLTYSGRKIAVGSQKPSRITRQNTCCVSESNTSVRVVFANRSGFDAPIGVVLAWEERGSCLNIFRTPNHGGISETFTNFEAKDLLRKLVKHVGSRCICEPEWF